MPAYTPDATAVTLPGDTGYSAAMGAAEFRAIKLYMRDALLAGINLKAPIADPVFTGTVAVADFVATGSAIFSNSPVAPTPAPGDSSNKLATTAFMTSLALSAILPGYATYPGRGLVSDGTQWVVGNTRMAKYGFLNALGYFS